MVWWEWWFLKLVDEVSQNRLVKNFKENKVSFRLNTDFFVKYAIEHKDDYLNRVIFNEVKESWNIIEQIKDNFNSETLKMYEILLNSGGLHGKAKTLLEEMISKLENNWK
jgi:hypothetical protein